VLIVAVFDERVPRFFHDTAISTSVSVRFWIKTYQTIEKIDLERFQLLDFTRGNLVEGESTSKPSTTKCSDLIFTQVMSATLRVLLVLEGPSPSMEGYESLVRFTNGRVG
jgi:hypothetical protein